MLDFDIGSVETLGSAITSVRLLLDLHFYPEDGGEKIPLNRLLNFSEIYGVAAQKFILFIPIQFRSVLVHLYLDEMFAFLWVKEPQ